MGLIIDTIGSGLHAVTGATSSSMFKEYFESGDMSQGILMKRGEKVNAKGNKNKRADENLISNGSVIDVQANQCMILVENGRIVDFCTEPGRYTVDNTTAPSLFCGENKGLKALGKDIMTQWSMGGQRGNTQRVFFINMGEIISAPIKWGCGDIAFRHFRRISGAPSPIELDMTVKGNGQLTVKISDPVKFYENIGAQVAGTDGDGVVSITDEGIYGNLKSAIVDKIGLAVSEMSNNEEVSYTEIRSKGDLISEYINKNLSEEWAGKRGFAVASFTVNGSFIPNDEDKKRLDDIQQSFVMSSNVNAMNYDVQKTMARGIENAGNNPNGGGIVGAGVGMGVVGSMGFGSMQNQNPQVQQQQPSGDSSTWTCSCGAVNSGKFCSECGNAMPEQSAGFCPQCGTKLAPGAKFCTNCGTKI